VQQGIAIVRMSQPKRKNALSGKMMAEFSDAVDELEKWEQGCGLILTGEGGTFCSGADLKTAGKYFKDPKGGGEMCRLMQDTMRRLGNLPLVSVSLIEGYATGGKV
jgi:enoyl-CoA hydratase/carnithine racemase